MSEDLTAYYQKSNRLKAKLIITISMMVLLMGAVAATLYFQKVEYQCDEVILVEINSETQIKDVFTNICNGKLLKRSTYFETETLGEKSIEVTFENFLGRKETKVIQYQVVDSQAPVIENELAYVFVYCDDSLEKLNEKIIVSDNSNGTLQKEIVGDYDLSSVGTYLLTCKVSDESGNEVSWKFKLIVEQHYEKQSDDYTTFKTSNGYLGIIKNGVSYIDGYLVVNKSYSVSKNMNAGLSNYVLQQFNTMATAAKQEGCNLKIYFDYQSYDYQNKIYSKLYQKQGQSKADNSLARAGHSEHQTGLAIDINSNNNSFASSKEFAWLNQNCYKYGFVLRYVEGKSEQTGFTYEPWHYRYVGTELATILYNGGEWLTIEEYFGINSEYESDFK